VYDACTRSLHEHGVFMLRRRGIEPVVFAALILSAILAWLWYHPVRSPRHGTSFSVPGSGTLRLIANSAAASDSEGKLFRHSR
jgi:hypothetical protein